MYEAACARETACVCESRCVSGTTFAPETARVCEPPCMNEQPRVNETASVSNMVCVNETPRVSAPACVSGMVCVSEARCVSERPCVRKTACVRSLCVREMTVGMREHAAASPGVSVMARCVSLVTRRSLSAWVERRRRLRQSRDKGRVAAVVLMGTAPGLHGGEHAVWAVRRTRPPRARLRE